MELSDQRHTCIVDASSAIILQKTGLFTFLLEYYRVIMPASVFIEITLKKHLPGSLEFVGYHNEDLFTIIQVDSAAGFPEIPYSLGRGESDCMRLYLQGKGSFIMIDDGDGAAFCRKKNIPHINAVLFPRILFLTGVLDADYYSEFSNRVIQAGRYAAWVLSFARSAGEEDIAFFL